jgi:antitoxin VapB
MGEPIKTRIFKSGNSYALRLPKALGVTSEGDMMVREEHGVFIVEPIPHKVGKIDLTGLWGTMPDLKPLRPEDRAMEERELDWTGAKVRHG